MSQKVIRGSKKIAERIKARRLELNLTIEEAASKAAVGIKTWCRYEAGGSIRYDKYRGICKALNWHAFPEEVPEAPAAWDWEEYRRHKAWSHDLEVTYGMLSALSFAVGSDIMLDYLDEDIQELATSPKGTHIGQLKGSWLASLLPQQFLMRYDYDFLYRLRSVITYFRNIAPAQTICAHSVLEELALYLMVDASRLVIENEWSAIVASGVACDDAWDEWLFDLFEDTDLLTFLYSDYYLEEENQYHFHHWTDQQFWCG